MRSFYTTFAAVGLLAVPGLLRADITYDANTTTGGDGSFLSTAPHFLELVTLNAPATTQTLTAIRSFGLRWNGIAQGNRVVQFRFWIGVNTGAGATDALAGATMLGTVSFTITPPPISQSLTYDFSFATGLVVPSNSFAIEVSILDAAGAALVTDGSMAGRLTTGSPSVGSNDGFIYQDDDGVFAGSERGQLLGTTSGAPVASNYRLQVDSIPEPATTVLLVGAGLAGLAIWRRR